MQQLSGLSKTHAARGACSCFCFVHFLFLFCTAHDCDKVRAARATRLFPSTLRTIIDAFFPVVFGAEAILDNKRAEGFLWCRARKRQFYWTPSTEKVVWQILENILNMILTVRFFNRIVGFYYKFYNIEEHWVQIFHILFACHSWLLGSSLWCSENGLKRRCGEFTFWHFKLKFHSILVNKQTKSKWNSPQWHQSDNEVLFYRSLFYFVLFFE